MAETVNIPCITRLCGQSKGPLDKSEVKETFLFFYRHFTTLLRQGCEKEVEETIDRVERGSFGRYTKGIHLLAKFVKALLLRNQGQAIDALLLFKKIAPQCEYLEELGIPNVKVTCYKEIGDLERFRRKYRQAIQYYQQSIDGLKQHKDSEYLLAVLLYNMSLCYYQMKNYRETMDYVNKVIPLVNHTSHSYLLLEGLLLKAALLSEYYHQHAMSNKALDWAYEIAERNGHTEVISKIWMIWGYNYHHLGKYALAEQAFDQSIQLSQECGEIYEKLRPQLLPVDKGLSQGREQGEKTLLDPAKEMVENIVANMIAGWTTV